MSFFYNLYYKTLVENEKNLRFWEDYLKKLESLDFSIFAEKLKVPALIPIGSRILFRGELKHTNEVTVALGADYFVKCSLKQAEVLRQHRIKDAKSKLDIYKIEREHLEKQVSFSKKNIYENEGQDIYEKYTEEDDKIWREKHRENVRKYKQNNQKEKLEDNITDEELWNRLEELELQEELENELQSMKDETQDSEDTKEKEPFVVKEENLYTGHKGQTKVTKTEKNLEFTEANETPVQTPKLDLLQQVIDKQNELEQKLFELKNKEKSQSKTEKDLMSRLDEMEELEELEDEMDRLGDILQTGDIAEVEEEDESDETSAATKLKRSVSFADEVKSNTIDITFEHSNVESYKEPYNPEKGITKPSDIYEAYSNLTKGETTSILKKSKYDTHTEMPVIEKNETIQANFENNKNTSKTIIIKDVVEKINESNNNSEENSDRPVSIFKKRRQQKKS